MKSELLQLAGVLLLFGAHNFKNKTESKELWWAADAAQQAGIALLGANSARKVMATLGERKAVRKRRKRAKPLP